MLVLGGIGGTTAVGRENVGVSERLDGWMDGQMQGKYARDARGWDLDDAVSFVLQHASLFLCGRFCRSIRSVSRV
jgi:hypothetical protein